MDLFEFLETFPGEYECLEYFIAARLKAGITCRECCCTTHHWVPGPDQFECNSCQNRINIKSGTVMEKSKLPIKYWFVAIELLTSSTEKIAITEIQEKLSGAELSQISEMLESLNTCLGNSKNRKSFDQLLVACVANQNNLSQNHKNH